MATGEPRRATAYSPRLIYLGAGFVLALLTLPLLWDGFGSQGASGRVELTRPGIRTLGPTAGVDSDAGGPTADGVPGGGVQALGSEPWPWRLDPRLKSQVGAAVQHFSSDAAAVSQGKANPSNVQVTVHVRDLDRHEIVLDIEGQRPMRPASNQKLITCAAALVLLGPNAQFVTSIEALGAVGDGVLLGDLIVRADGDPLYLEGGDGSLDPWLDPVADSLLAAGICRVPGGLVLDEGSYALPEPGPGWPAARDHWQEYCALSGGFSANAGCLTSWVTPGRVGRNADVLVLPRGHGLPRKGSVVTGARGANLDVRVGANQWGLTVGGSIPADTKSGSWRFAHPDPVDLFGHAVIEGLDRRGVSVEGGFRRERDRPAGRLVAQFTTALSSYLVPILTHSNNSVADQVFLHLGAKVAHRGDRFGGSLATQRALEILGIAPLGFVQVDGSGLSRDNRVSASQLTALIAAVMDREDGSAIQFLEALPLAGLRGSLERRLTGQSTKGRVWGKTGFINGTSALSGVVRTSSERTLAFSILVEYRITPGLNTRCWKPMQDRICSLLVSL
jgi:D-alanyl-D-alanine carboxypeptidase/D-alanyl-D-alanine-endopeptidase (penicillin-binding protein 4)